MRDCVPLSFPVSFVLTLLRMDAALGKEMFLVSPDTIHAGWSPQGWGTGLHLHPGLLLLQEDHAQVQTHIIRIPGE